MGLNGIQTHQKNPQIRNLLRFLICGLVLKQRQIRLLNDM